MSLAQVRKSMGVPAKRGDRVIRLWGKRNPRAGTIESGLGEVLRVDFDDERGYSWVHAKHELVYMCEVKSKGIEAVLSAIPKKLNTQELKDLILEELRRPETVPVEELS